jgi:hypothetical protein
MKFTRQQIEWAIELKNLGIPWNPAVGHYAYDLHGEIKPGSPFQDAVYFFLNYPCFIEYFGSENTLVERMVWLPTLEQALAIAVQFHVPVGLVEQALFAGVRRSDELSELYQLLARVIGSERDNPKNVTYES